MSGEASTGRQSADALRDQMLGFVRAVMRAVPVEPDDPAYQQREALLADPVSDDVRQWERQYVARRHERARGPAPEAIAHRPDELTRAIELRFNSEPWPAAGIFARHLLRLMDETGSDTWAVKPDGEWERDSGPLPAALLTHMGIRHAEPTQVTRKELERYAHPRDSRMRQAAVTDSGTPTVAEFHLAVDCAKCKAALAEFALIIDGDRLAVRPVRLLGKSHSTKRGYQLHCKCGHKPAVGRDRLLTLMKAIRETQQVVRMRVSDSAFAYQRA